MQELPDILAKIPSKLWWPKSYSCPRAKIKSKTFVFPFLYFSKKALKSLPSFSLIPTARSSLNVASLFFFSSPSSFHFFFFFFTYPWDNTTETKPRKKKKKKRERKVGCSVWELGVCDLSLYKKKPQGRQDNIIILNGGEGMGNQSVWNGWHFRGIFAWPEKTIGILSSPPTHGFPPYNRRKEIRSLNSCFFVPGGPPENLISSSSSAPTWKRSISHTLPRISDQKSVFGQKMRGIEGCTHCTAAAFSVVFGRARNETAGAGMEFNEKKLS